MGSLKREEIEKLHIIFPDATFTMSLNSSTSSGFYGGDYRYDELLEWLNKYPITEYIIQDFEGLGELPVIREYPSVSVHVLRLTNEDKR